MEPHHITSKDTSEPLLNPVVKLVFISDTHESESWEKQVPAGDILIHTGDFSKLGNTSEVAAFKAKFLSLPHNHKILIAGNHEPTFDDYLTTTKRQELDERFPSLKGVDTTAIKNSLKSAPELIYLENSATTVEGITFWGSPFTPKFAFWAFQKEREELSEIWDRIPSGVDVLLTHGPPAGILDKFDETGIGCENLLKQVLERVKPKIHAFGHVHNAHGWEHRGATLFLNSSICDRRNIAWATPKVCRRQQMKDNPCRGRPHQPKEVNKRNPKGVNTNNPR